MEADYSVGAFLLKGSNNSTTSTVRQSNSSDMADQPDDSSSSSNAMEESTDIDGLPRSPSSSKSKKSKKKRPRRSNVEDMPCGLEGCTKVFHSNWDLSRHRRYNIPSSSSHIFIIIHVFVIYVESTLENVLSFATGLNGNTTQYLHTATYTTLISSFLILYVFRSYVYLFNQKTPRSI